MMATFVYITSKYPPKQPVFRRLHLLFFLQCQNKPLHHVGVLDLETYTNVQFSTHCAISRAMLLNITDFYTPKSSNSTVGGGVGFSAGMFCFLLADVAVFCGRHALSSTPNGSERKVCRWVRERLREVFASSLWAILVGVEFVAPRGNLSPCRQHCTW